MGYGSCRTDGYSVGQWTILCEIHIQGQPPDWEDFLGILFLLIVNSTIRFIEENNVGNAAAALMAHRAPKTKKMLQVFRESDVICHSVRRSRVHTSSHIQNLPCHLNNTL
ncbi:hypothetical protein BDL97_01G056700 [Sphagnum fallax]|nr:hypothetical protein BDL97_01G056700 [Sphagnum fallax]